MLKDSYAFSGFSVDDLETAKNFYARVLDIEVTSDEMGFHLHVAGGNPIFVYEKDNHEPASYTILNFPVDDIDTAVDELINVGVVMERYDEIPGMQDEKGIARGKAADRGPDIAWFKDPAGNILSVLSD